MYSTTMRIVNLHFLQNVQNGQKIQRSEQLVNTRKESEREREKFILSSRFCCNDIRPEKEPKADSFFFL